MYGSKDSKSRRTSKLHHRFKSYDIFSNVFCQRGGTRRWRVCYQRGLPRLVTLLFAIQVKFQVLAKYKIVLTQVTYLHYVIVPNLHMNTNYTFDMKGQKMFLLNC